MNKTVLVLFGLSLAAAVSGSVLLASAEKQNQALVLADTQEATNTPTPTLEPTVEPSPSPSPISTPKQTTSPTPNNKAICDQKIAEINAKYDLQINDMQKTLADMKVRIENTPDHCSDSLLKQGKCKVISPGEKLEKSDRYHQLEKIINDTVNKKSEEIKQVNCYSN